MASGTVSDFNRCVGAQSELCEETGTNRDSGKRKLELIEALWSSTAADGIPEGFRSDESRRVAPGGKEATSTGTLVFSSLLEGLGA